MGTVSAQSGNVSRQEVQARDELTAAQESLLNVYRCRFGIDTQIVPGGCASGQPRQGATQPAQFRGTPTQRDLNVRDQLVANQEALLNVYRCRFNIDTHVVPGGCSGTPTPTATPTPTPTPTATPTPTPTPTATPTPTPTPTATPTPTPTPTATPTPTPEPTHICTFGLILKPGESCKHPDGPEVFTVNEGGGAYYLWRDRTISPSPSPGYEFMTAYFGGSYRSRSFHALSLGELGWMVTEEGLRSSKDLTRSTTDRPDDVSGWQLHPIYLIASDGVDDELDRTGWIADHVYLTLDFITFQTGRRLRVDTFNGEMDVTFVRHGFTEEEFRQCGGVICWGFGNSDARSEEEFFGIGSMENKVYLVFFGHRIEDPKSHHNSGRASADRGGPDRPGSSMSYPMNLSEGYHVTERVLYTVTHETLHLLGAVPVGAPHRDAGSHVCDGPDVMSYCEYGLLIDPGRDDYYGHDLPGVWDIEDSPLWMDPPPED